MVAFALYRESSGDGGAAERPPIGGTSKVEAVIDRPGDRVVISALRKHIDHTSIVNALHIDIGRIQHVAVLAPIRVVLRSALEDIVRKCPPCSINRYIKSSGVGRVEVKLPATVSSDASEEFRTRLRN